MTTQTRCPRGRRRAFTALSFAAAIGLAGETSAFHIDTDNPDLKLRFDTTLRYNLGLRAQDCNRNVCGNGAGLGDVTACLSVSLGTAAETTCSICDS